MAQTLSRTPAPARVVAEVNRMVVLTHAFMFVLGFAIVFVLLGSAASWIGRSLIQYTDLIQKGGALLLLLFALITLGLFHRLSDWISTKVDLARNPAAQALVNILTFFDSLLYTERRVADMHSVNRNFGYLSSILVGISFGAGWTPCIGPILGSIMILASSSTTVTEGALLLAIYSLGLGLPFLLTGFAFSRATRFLRRMNRHLGIVSIISGLFLLYVAYLLWFGRLTALTTQFSSLNNIVFAIEDWLGIVSGTSGDVGHLGFALAAPLAFVAGIISFISPCVLPLVPAYLGFLTGAAVSGRQQK